MNNDDIKWMKEAIAWAERCNPVNASIPKVGAIIAVGSKVLGRGRRGTGTIGDDEHAELDALNDVNNKSDLPDATLYTTLEPCTPGVRSNPLLCCTQLILQHQIKKVYIGILDPNQGVTGKGLWELQDHNIEVELFPPDLARQVRSINADFIRTQRTLGAKIISPTDGEQLATYRTGGKFTVKLKCLNPPDSNTTFLFTNHGELWWPQFNTFRRVEGQMWEIDAHVGTTGDHIVHIVTAAPMGQTLIAYYRKIVNQNLRCQEYFKSKLSETDFRRLVAPYPGIPMTGLPKGFLSEGCVTVTIAANPQSQQR